MAATLIFLLPLLEAMFVCIYFSPLSLLNALHLFSALFIYYCRRPFFYKLSFHSSFFQILPSFLYTPFVHFFSFISLSLFLSLSLSCSSLFLPSFLYSFFPFFLFIPPYLASFIRSLLFFSRFYFLSSLSIFLYFFLSIKKQKNKNFFLFTLLYFFTYLGLLVPISYIFYFHSYQSEISNILFNIIFFLFFWRLIFRHFYLL